MTPNAVISQQDDNILLHRNQTRRMGVEEASHLRL
jgi:hypothetical protein